jgi:hypothetical protein
MSSRYAAGSATENKRILAIAGMGMLIIGAFYNLASTPWPVSTLSLSMVFEGASVAVGVRAFRVSRSTWRAVFATQILAAGIVLIDALVRLLLHASLIGLLVEWRS